MTTVEERYRCGDFEFGGELVNWQSEDRDYFLDLKERVIAAMTQVKGELRDARKEFASGGESADYDWLRRAENYVRLLGRAVQAIQQRCGECSKVTRLANATKSDGEKRVWERLFVDVAKDTLTGIEYRRICTMASERQQEREAQAS